MMILFMLLSLSIVSTTKNFQFFLSFHFFLSGQHLFLVEVNALTGILAPVTGILRC